MPFLNRFTAYCSSTISQQKRFLFYCKSFYIVYLLISTYKYRFKPFSKSHFVITTYI
nr:MAG TPA: hypothetical protein [Caudoviricetes sp.]